MGENMSDEELKEMIKIVNNINEDEINEEDFIKFMSKNHLEY
jgi:Ca2+-binding EF-hand superfamily protein